MDIQEFLEKREQLREWMNSLIARFEKDTGIMVESIFIAEWDERIYKIDTDL